MLKIINIVGP